MAGGGDVHGRRLPSAHGRCQPSLQPDGADGVFDGVDNLPLRPRCRINRLADVVRFPENRSRTATPACRGSETASSMRTAMRCCVRVPANASRCPPGFSTRRHSAQISTLGVVVPALAHEARPYGGSVTTLSTLASGRVRSTSRQSPRYRVASRSGFRSLLVIPKQLRRILCFHSVRLSSR